MTFPSRPRIVVTLTARDHVGSRTQIREALEDGADLAEVRVDRWSPEERRSLSALFPSPLPLVATYRSRAEGGEGEPLRRAEALEELATFPFAYLDLEVARDLPLEGELARRMGRPEAPQPLFSAHLPRGSSPKDLHRLLSEVGTARAPAKVVMFANLDTLLTEVLPGLPPPTARPYVVHTTGPSGPLLRAWARRLGMALVFAAPGRSRSAGSVEESQIPCDRLARFLHGAPDAPLFALLGHPVSHSISPELHERWMEMAGVEGMYLLLDVASSSEFVGAVPVLGAGGFRGVNVTHPFKRDALAVAIRAGRAAERAGCANVLTFREGEVEAENTDVAAVIRRVRELRDEAKVDPDRVTVVGAGGAARAALTALEALGLSAEVVARDPVRASALAAEFGAEVRDPTVGSPASLFIHATPAGRRECPELGIPLLRLVGRDSYILDFVHAPLHRFLEERAARHGARYEDGRALLAYQAAESFALWWGVPVDPQELKRAARGGS